LNQLSVNEQVVFLFPIVLIYEGALINFRTFGPHSLAHPSFIGDYVKIKSYTKQLFLLIFSFRMKIMLKL